MVTLTLKNLQSATTAELLDFYNQKTGRNPPLARFSTRTVGLNRARAILLQEAAAQPPAAGVQLTLPGVGEKPSRTHPNQAASLKLDRTVCVSVKGKILPKTYPNVHAMWRAHPGWMTSSQEDAVTAALYKAARNGEKGVTYTIGERTFWLEKYV